MESDEYERDRAKTEELFQFLQGKVPEGYTIRPSHVPTLTPDQAWTVIWYLGNQYWQVPDHVERCDVCGCIYNSWSEGDTVDCAPPPIFFCGSCRDGSEHSAKVRIQRGLERSQKRARRCESVTC